MTYFKTCWQVRSTGVSCKKKPGGGGEGLGERVHGGGEGVESTEAGSGMTSSFGVFFFSSRETAKFPA